MELLEALSYLVTILGFPIAIFVFVYEHRRRLSNDENELHRLLSEEYDNFVRLTLDNADLLIWRSTDDTAHLNEEQLERRRIIYMMLVSLFEKAYIILFSENMSQERQRRWLSWEDDMHEWCGKKDFASQLPELLEGEDSAFSQHILAIARQC